MLLAVKEFIMENFTWMDIVVSGITLLSVIVTVVMLCKSDKNTRETLLDKHNVREKEHDSLSKEHDSLSKEHSNLSKEHDSLSKEHFLLAEKQNEMQQALTYLKETALVEQTKKEVLSKEMLDIVKTTEHINALISVLAETKAENAALKNECEALKQENTELKEIVQRYQERDADMEL